ncbi:predicted protein, partial [Nematostella vectensis]
PLPNPPYIPAIHDVTLPTPGTDQPSMTSPYLPRVQTPIHDVTSTYPEYRPP